MRTTARTEGSFSYTWNFAICPHRVQIDLSVVEALQVEMAAGAEPRHGLLLGRIAPSVVEIDEWRPIASLQAADVEAALRDETRDVMGYYVIREGSAFILSPAEVAVAQQYFSKPGSVVLLVERRKRGPAEATFYFWRGDVFVHNLPLPFPLHAGLLSGDTPGLQEVPRAASNGLGSGARRRAVVIGLYAASALAVWGTVATKFSREPGRAVSKTKPASKLPAPEAAWISAEPKRDLELTWDAAADSVANATAGVLKIEDAGTARQMSLDVGELLLGTILYAPASERFRVELTALQRDGRMVPVPVVAQPIVESSPLPVAAAQPAAPAMKTAPVPLAGVTLKKPEVVRPAAETGPPPRKRFTWTAADRAASEPATAFDIPHDAPAVLSPAVLTADLRLGNPGIPTLPPAPPPRPAPAPPSAAAPKAAVPRSGRLIWTGTLLRRGVVELDGRAASVGSLNGFLPGVPVSVSVTPAEFGEDGLMVYTTDASRHNRVEPPSAGNGWNKVTWVWAPERVREIAILESPTAANGFNRLALRSDARRCSMLLIDWNQR